ncbi:MAG: sensor histidine kinase, partial [Verrucomicrobiales bacterium]|nr:sensor histidine kinase [Verrucomicrobiales bacterium]
GDWAGLARAAILWRDPGPRLAHNTGQGSDILHGAVRRDDSASDTLYFKFHVDPLSDVSDEEYYAGFQLFETNAYRLAIGNAPDAWAYSAFYTSETGPSNKVAGDYDLYSSRPELSGPDSFRPYELPRRGNGRTIVFRVQYIPGGDDRVTVWLSPNLGLGATPENQPESLTTTFKANASFDQIRLRHVGGGGGWVFSDMAIATSFHDFIQPRLWQRWWFVVGALVILLGAVGASVRFVERRKFKLQLARAEQERALARERARIAQDLHDELGASLTRISLLSDLARADKHDPTLVETHVEKISQSAAESIRALEEIVWAVRPGADTLQSLVDYIAHVANEMFIGGQTRCRLDLPHDLPARPLPPEMRHNLFLVVKEALTNALKHAGASEVHVQVKTDPRTLEITVQDNGRGFDSAAANPHRNGLENMRRRAESLRARLTVQSAPGRGTTVRLAVDFPEQASTR